VSYELEEEEFTSKVNRRIVLRMLAQVRPYWHWAVGFLAMIAGTSLSDSYFTYLDSPSCRL